MNGKIKTSFKEFIKENYYNNELVQQYIDVIDSDPDNPRFDKYKKILSDNFGVVYLSPEERYKSDIELINLIDNVDLEVKTKKGLDIRIISTKIPNLLRTLRLSVYHEDILVAELGFNIDLEANTLRIGGVEVIEEYRRKCVYTEMVNIVLDICDKYGLDLIDSGRSEDVKEFWKTIDK